VSVLAIAGRAAGVPDCGVPCDVVTDLHTVHEDDALGRYLLGRPADGGGYRVTSYWVSIQGDAEGNRKFMHALDSYVDTCIKVDALWRLREKIIDPIVGRQEQQSSLSRELKKGRSDG
jgi:hypothetical protein